MRYCSFIRILCCPFRSPLSDSDRLAGGILNSSSKMTESSWSSFRTAIRHKLSGHVFLATLERLPLKMSSVPVSLNDRIRSSMIARNPCYYNQPLRNQYSTTCGPPFDDTAYYPPYNSESLINCERRQLIMCQHWRYWKWQIQKSTSTLSTANGTVMWCDKKGPTACSLVG